jgi:UDP-N-acetylmuramyl tripeptide synthase
MAVIAAKLVEAFIRLFRLGAGATWPGEIALRINPGIAKPLSSQIRKGIILIAGTNGKTTTALMLTKILKSRGERVVFNRSGANLLNGIVSSLVSSASWMGNVDADWGIFEVDENSLPEVLSHVKPRVVVLLNLFRDQLDRYGEVDVIVEKWEKALKKLAKDTTLVINADDPGIAHLGRRGTAYFGLNDSKLFLKGFEHATDSTFCPKCGTRLVYEGTYLSHLGVWHCDACGWKRPDTQVSTFPSALPGLYNQYNTLAAVATAKAVGISQTHIRSGLRNFVPAFGRQEEFMVDGRKIRLFLSKNPAGFNASLRTVLEMGAKHFLIILNDRIPDGRDVSWIWDVDFEMLPASARIVVSGDRVWDMAIRMKYADRTKYLIVEQSLLKAVYVARGRVPKGGTLFVLPTYSAMLEVRKILTGRKIL